ncbi:MAG: exodeoxyribonuclease VII small subunit [Candidatus Avilachnospira sp.]
MAAEGKKKKSIEENFSELDSILEDMDREDCPLEKSFELYERGIKLVKELNDSIEKVEEKLKIIGEEAPDTEE